MIGSIVGARHDLADVFALRAAARAYVVTVEREPDEALDEARASINDVLADRAAARVGFRS